MKRTLIVCGTGIATSTVMAKKVEEESKKRGIEVETRQCKASEVSSNIEGIDFIVSTISVPEDIGVSVVRTLAFLQVCLKNRLLKR